VLQNIAAMLHQANYKLTRLGRSLFYFYLFLTLLGVVGGLLTITTILQKILVPASTLSAWWEIIALGIVSYGSIKFFRREASRLLEADRPPAPEPDYEATDTPEAPASNVIPFNRKESS
jgi:hypothetical protein